METKFNFKSAICTSREQSEKLSALGLKIETADCYHWQETDRYGDGNGKWHCEILSEYNKDHNEYLYNVYGVDGSDEGFFIPAWSLHRLIEIVPSTINKMLWFTITPYTALYDSLDYSKSFDGKDNLYDNIIDCIEWLIKQGYFNKEYLEAKQ
jgi:hypothetical protein